ncbi:MAG: VanZ family protein [bacterium]
MKKIYLWFLTFSWAAYTFYLTTIPNFSPSPDTFLNWILSNGGHFFFFGILAVFLKLSISPISDLRSTISAITITSFYGYVIELIQRGIPGRSYDLKDWALDTLGAIAFLAIISWYEHPRDWRSWLHRSDHR